MAFLGLKVGSHIASFLPYSAKVVPDAPPGSRGGDTDWT